MVIIIGHLISAEKIAKTGLESIFAYLKNNGNEFTLKELSYETLDSEANGVDILLFKANSLLVSTHDKDVQKLIKLKVWFISFGYKCIVTYFIYYFYFILLFYVIILFLLSSELFKKISKSDST
jgi:hypothetical protein